MKRFAIAVLAVFIAAAVAMPAQAQDNQLYPDRVGSLYLSAEEGSYVSSLTTGGANFTVYLVADIDFADVGDAGQNLSNGIGAWEAAVTLPDNPGLFLLTTIYTQAVDVGNKDTNVKNFIVGTGTTLSVGQPTTLVTFNLLETTPLGPTAMTLGPATPASYAGEVVWREAAALNGCDLNGADEKCIFRFAFLGSLSLNGGVDNDADSFGSMKARF